jgi:DNA-binding transcriptional LysR family regulator
MLSLERLADMATFARVVDAGSFSAAALQLGLSKSAVSKAVSRLEAHLDLRLLSRTTRRLTPTEAGLTFHAYCRQVVASAEEAEQHLGQLRDVPSGLLRMTCPLTFGVARVAPALPVLLARYPALRVSVVVDDRVVDLVAENFDMALRMGRLPDSSLVARKLADLHSVLVASPAYIAQAGEPRRPADLLRHHCLSFGDRAEATTWQFEGPQGLESVQTQGRLMLNTSLGIREAALAGIGIADVASYLVADDLAAGRLVALMPGYRSAPIPLYAVYPHHRHLAAKVKVAIEFFQEVFQRDGGLDHPVECLPQS